MEALLNDLMNKLTEFKDHIVALGDVKDAHEAAKNELDTLTKTLTDTKAELAKAQAGMSISQLKNLKEHEEAIFTKRKELEGLLISVSETKSTLDDMLSQVATSSQRHSQIEASIESLRKRLG